MSYYDNITAVESAVINLIKTDTTILQYVTTGNIQDSDYILRLKKLYPGISIVLKKEPDSKQPSGMSHLNLSFQIRVYSGIIPLNQAKDNTYRIVSRIKEIFETVSKINSTKAFFDCKISDIDFDKEIAEEHYTSSNNISKCAEITLLTNSYIKKTL